MKKMLYIEQQKLKKDIAEAIAWGIPDRESIGCSPTEFIKLLSKALKYINYLESQELDLETIANHCHNATIEQALDALVEHGFINSKNIIKPIKPTHGNCCTCQVCGRYHDECVCKDNEMIETIRNI